jgi:uncharacterized Zn finger protein
MSFYEWKPYVPVAKRRAQARRELEKMRKKGLKVQPVEVAGRRIAGSFWGKGWCDHMESFHDYANRLPRGRTYVRNGSVCHLNVQSGRIEAIVSGSELYNVIITIAPLAKKKWEAVKSACTGRISSLIDFLRGKLAGGVMEVVCHRQTGLFPLPGEIKFDCDCPDWADMCKHVAAVLYGVGARLDHEPEKLFLLRGVNHEELVDVSAAVKKTTGKDTSRRRIAATGLADVFGIEVVENGAGTDPAAGAAPPPAGKRAPRMEKPQPIAEEPTPVTALKGAKAVRTAVKGPEPALSPPPPPFPKRLTGKAILKWRNSLGETQGEFAARIGVSAGCVSQWERKGAHLLSVREGTLPALHKAWSDTNKEK